MLVIAGVLKFVRFYTQLHYLLYLFAGAPCNLRVSNFMVRLVFGRVSRVGRVNRWSATLLHYSTCTTIDYKSKVVEGK